MQGSDDPCATLVAFHTSEVNGLFSEGSRLGGAVILNINFKHLAVVCAVFCMSCALDLDDFPPSDQRAIPATQPSEQRQFMRGMTISCPTYGQIWGSQHMIDTLSEVSALGVNWVSIHPYAQITTSGQVIFTPSNKLPYLEKAISHIEKKALSLFLKPHLAYWGAFSWRGQISFETEAQWNQFFSDYGRFILDQARLAQKHRVPFFAVGVELDATVHRPEWTELIKKIRHVYKGELTYAANWDRYQSVPFWGQLDAIGIQGYFPLRADHSDVTAGFKPDWTPIINPLVRFARAHKRPLLFTEIGYARSRDAANQPWKPDLDPSESAILLREKLMTHALVRLQTVPEIRGLFWWKWIPGDERGNADFSMKDPEARAILLEHWRGSAKQPASEKK